MRAMTEAASANVIAAAIIGIVNEDAIGKVMKAELGDVS